MLNKKQHPRNDDNDDFEELPDEIFEQANKYVENLLPEKSRDKYLITYDHFRHWQSERKGREGFEEPVILTYIGEQGKRLAPSTLWNLYSKLKSCLKIYHDVDITEYHLLQAYLRKNAVGYVPKKSRVLTAAEIANFFNYAPDFVYLGIKAILAVGIAGCLRKDELVSISINIVKDTGEELIIDIPKTKTHEPKKFCVDGEFYAITKKYMALRPEVTDSSRFFLRYEKGKCMNQVIGTHKFGEVPQLITKQLNLPQPETYTGHMFRRTSATLLAEAGGTITELKKHGNWRSITVAEGYVENSMYAKHQVSGKIRGLIRSSSNMPTSTITSTTCTGANAPLSENRNMNFSNGQSSCKVLPKSASRTSTPTPPPPPPPKRSKSDPVPESSFNKENMWFSNGQTSISQNVASTTSSTPPLSKKSKMNPLSAQESEIEGSTTCNESQNSPNILRTTNATITINNYGNVWIYTGERPKN